MTETGRSAIRELADFEPFARCWIADDRTTAVGRAREWAMERLAPRGLTVSEFRWDDLEDPVSMPTLPLPHPADVVVAGVSDAGSRRRAQALVNLFGCSIAIVPEGGAPGQGVVCGVDHLANAAMTASAAAIEAEHASEPLLLVHAVPAQLAAFSARPGHADPALRVAREHVERNHPSVACTCRIRAAAPVHALLDEARTASLLVVGGERISSSVSVLGELIERTPVPLLVARGGGSSRLSA